MKGGDLSGAIERMSFQQRFQTLVRMVRALRWVHENHIASPLQIEDRLGCRGQTNACHVYCYAICDLS